MAFPTHFLGPASLLVVQTSSRGNSFLLFASLDLFLIWLTLWLRDCDAVVLAGPAFSLPACTLYSFEAVFLVQHCRSGKCIIVHLEQNICCLDCIFH